MAPPPSPTSSVAPTPPPRLSVVVPLYNCLALTQAMLASLQATVPAGLRYEVILVDDGSTDGTRAWLQTLRDRPPAAAAAPEFHVVLNDRNLGYAAANNRGARLARGEWLALLNNDLILLPGWLEPMLAALTALGERAGLVGNVQLDAASGAVDHAGLVVNVTGKPVHARALPPVFARWIRPVRRVPAVTGACVVLARPLWEQLGGFDEGYMNGGEDIDLCFRARELGRVNVVALRSVVRHHVSASPGRKQRDEHNSRRLALRWRDELIAAADDGTRTWCRGYLAQALAIPESREYRLALAACGFLAHLRRTPPPEAVAAVTAGLEGEFARWDRILGVATPP
ncbi:glycosyltransferase family 2 protein [Horticoccus sp. 23ND18S-11]|uniref:glycosyltransferase family 2 protein n=1 Tax=Horticoccus sp. 23ND18S-11 TaxID=3391832 RepID=UPI0039C9B50D